MPQAQDWREQEAQQDLFLKEYADPNLVRGILDSEDMVVEVARYNPSVFCAYVLRDEKGMPIKQQPFHREWHDLATAHRNLLVWAFVEAGKCLGRGTLVLRYDGQLVPVEDVRVGDSLMGPDSTPRYVRSTTSGVGPLYRVVPRKGDPWVCNDAHVLTLVHTTTGEVVDVGVQEYLRKPAWWKAGHKQFQPDGVTFPPVDPPEVDPYFLGVWFGDGARNLRDLRVTKPDAEIAQCCQDFAASYGVECRTDVRPGKCPVYRIVGSLPGSGHNPALLAVRKAVGDGSRFPDAYLRGSLEVRAQFLAGLLDTDGSLDKGSFDLVQKRRAFAEGACFLARSLGLRATLKPKAVNGTTYWRVSIMGNTDVLPLRLARRIAGLRKSKRDALRTGISVEALGDGEYFGFTLDGDGRFLLGDFQVTHNTQQFSVGRLLWNLGQDVNLRQVAISNTGGLSSKIVTACASYIESSPEYHKVFPHVRRDRRKAWNSSSLFIERDADSLDASIAATGLHGNILGSRIDRLIYDDILDYESTLSAHRREDTARWCQATLEGRLTKDARCQALSNAWHHDDYMHRLAARPDWVATKYPILSDDGTSLWRERWPLARIEEKRVLGPLEFNRQLMCSALSDEDARFKRAYIDTCLARGDGIPAVFDIKYLPAGYRTYTGVDLAVGRTEKSDLTAIFTILVHPNEDREVLCCESGRWSAPDIIRRIEDTHRRYKSIVYVENNAAQDYIVQMTRAKTAVPVMAITTTKQSISHPDFGLESMAVELAGGKWIIPSRNGRAVLQDVEAWIAEMLFYDPATHKGDRLMASWFAREATRKQRPVARTGVIHTVRR